MRKSHKTIIWSAALALPAPMLIAAGATIPAVALLCLSGMGIIVGPFIT
jgi:hypothetical protein